jgi:hypothetical protein
MVRRRDREPTPEEAIEIAREDNLPFWHDSPPLFAAYREKTGGAKIFPIDPEFIQKRFLLVLLDPYSTSGIAGLSDAIEFDRRFGDQGLPLLLILRLSFAFQKATGYLENLAQKSRWNFPVCYDPDGAIFEAFGVKDVPHAVVMDKGSVLAKETGPLWAQKLEPFLHRYLREGDPGLSLPIFFSPNRSEYADAGAISFGSRFPAGPDVQFTGEWKVEEEFRSTRDPKASIQFSAPAPGLSVIARSMDSAFLPAELVVDLNGVPPRDIRIEKDVERDESGNARLKLDQPRFLKALNAEGDPMARITLRFPHAHRVPVGIYGVRFHRKVPGLKAQLQAAATGPAKI